MSKCKIAREGRIAPPVPGSGRLAGRRGPTRLVRSYWDEKTALRPRPPDSHSIYNKSSIYRRVFGLVARESPRARRPGTSRICAPAGRETRRDGPNKQCLMHTLTHKLHSCGSGRTPPSAARRLRARVVAGRGARAPDRRRPVPCARRTSAIWRHRRHRPRRAVAPLRSRVVPRAALRARQPTPLSPLPRGAHERRIEGVSTRRVSASAFACKLWEAGSGAPAGLSGLTDS